MQFEMSTERTVTAVIGVLLDVMEEAAELVERGESAAAAAKLRDALTRAAIAGFPGLQDEGWPRRVASSAPGDDDGGLVAGGRLLPFECTHAHADEPAQRWTRLCSDCGQLWIVDAPPPCL